MILVRNLNLNDSLSIGTRLLITKIKQHVLEAKILSGKKKKIFFYVFLPRILFNLFQSEFPFSFHRRQFPAKLAYCCTINIAQGQTIIKVGFYIDGLLFSHGL